VQSAVSFIKKHRYAPLLKILLSFNLVQSTVSMKRYYDNDYHYFVIKYKNVSAKLCKIELKALYQKKLEAFFSF